MFYKLFKTLPISADVVSVIAFVLAKVPAVSTYFNADSTLELVSACTVVPSLNVAS